MCLYACQNSLLKSFIKNYSKHRIEYIFDSSYSFQQQKRCKHKTVWKAKRFWAVNAKRLLSWWQSHQSGLRCETQMTLRYDTKMTTMSYCWARTKQIVCLHHLDIELFSCQTVIWYMESLRNSVALWISTSMELHCYIACHDAVGTDQQQHSVSFLSSQSIVTERSTRRVNCVENHCHLSQSVLVFIGQTNQRVTDSWTTDHWLTGCQRPVFIIRASTMPRLPSGVNLLSSKLFSAMKHLQVLRPARLGCLSCLGQSNIDASSHSWWSVTAACKRLMSLFGTTMPDRLCSWLHILSLKWHWSITCLSAIAGGWTVFETWRVEWFMWKLTCVHMRWLQSIWQATRRRRRHST